jgi:hypothetical protein
LSLPPGLISLGGSTGQNVAEFDIVKETPNLLINGIVEYGADAHA